MPSLPDPGALTPEVRYQPLPGNNAMPTQEIGSKPARPLPFQPNANLVDFTTDTSGNLVAVLDFSNIDSFVTKASHFAVYNNLAGVPSLAAYPGAFPGEYTVPTGKALSGTGAVGASDGDTAYDITVVARTAFSVAISVTSRVPGKSQGRGGLLRRGRARARALPRSEARTPREKSVGRARDLHGHVQQLLIAGAATHCGSGSR
jgi:hypothetical protein